MYAEPHPVHSKVLNFQGMHKVMPTYRKHVLLPVGLCVTMPIYQLIVKCKTYLF